MYELDTGAPGSGKTLSVIDKLKDGVKFPNRDDFRPIFYYGVTLLPEDSPTLNWTKLQNPKMWHEEVPDGAIVFIDEAQEHFPVRSPSQPVPDGLKAIERHRHRGIDIYFTTQHPAMLDVHARRLVNEHIHFKRNFGAPFSVRYRANECMEDPKDYHSLQRAEKTTFRYPSATFALYKSAEVHTHRFKVPKTLYAFLILIPLVCYFLYSGFHALSHDKPSKTASDSKDKAKPDVSSKDGNALVDSHRLTLDSFKPIIPNVPASSPAYQSSWKPKSSPIVSSCIGTAKNCRCYSQQGTLLAVSADYCLYILANGTNYDHTLTDNRFSSDSSNAKTK